MATPTGALVHHEDLGNASEWASPPGFLAGSTDSTRVSYTSDRRLYAPGTAAPSAHAPGQGAENARCMASDVEPVGSRRGEPQHFA